MTTKQVMKMIVGLHQCRMNDLEMMDQGFRLLSGRINIQGKMLGLLAELQADTFSGNEEELAEFLRILEGDADIAKDVEREANRFQTQRDQCEAAIETMKAILAGMADD